MQWLLMYSYCAAVWCPRPHRNTYIYVFILILHTFWRCLHAARSMCACVCARHVQCTVYPFWQASLPLWPKRVDRLRPSDIQTFGRPLPAAHTNKAKWQWQTQMHRAHTHAQGESRGGKCATERATLGDKCLFGTLRNHKASILWLLNDLISMRVYSLAPGHTWFRALNSL